MHRRSCGLCASAVLAFGLASGAYGQALSLGPNITSPAIASSNASRIRITQAAYQPSSYTYDNTVTTPSVVNGGSFLHSNNVSIPGLSIFTGGSGLVGLTSAPGSSTISVSLTSDFELRPPRNSSSQITTDVNVYNDLAIVFTTTTPTDISFSGASLMNSGISFFTARAGLDAATDFPASGLGMFSILPPSGVINNLPAGTYRLYVETWLPFNGFSFPPGSNPSASWTYSFSLTATVVPSPAGLAAFMGMGLLGLRRQRR
jgi:hypothetical protein